jgi:hydrogenase nickel incorporation protein HypA/HybF
MHEVSVAAHVISEVAKAARANNAGKVVSVTLEVGELSLLGRAQLKFAYDVISQAEEGGLLRGSKLTIRISKGKIKCGSCGYLGGIRNIGKRNGKNHFLPVFCCPRCGGRVEIISGRDCIIKDIKLTVMDVKKAKPSRKPGKRTGSK